MRPGVCIVLLAMTLGGCLGDAPASTPVLSPAPPVVPAFEADHDHLDPSLHDASSNVDLVSYHNLVPGTDGHSAADRGNWLNSEIIVRGTTAYVGYIGGPWRVAIVDLADPARPVLRGAFADSNAWAMDVSVSDDGDWVYIAMAPGATGTVFDPQYLLKAGGAPTGVDGPGVVVVDARDRADPKLSSFTPVHGLGPHTVVYHRYADGREFLFANRADVNPGNVIVVMEIVPTPAGGRTLKPASTFALDAAGAVDFPHDVDVQEHPLTHRVLLYAAWWDSGVAIVDVTDPSHPVLTGRFTDYPPGEEVQIHDVHPFPMLVGGRHYTVSAPEIPAGPTSGHVRIYDTTDPARPRLVGGWILPGEYGVPKAFMFSTHNFQFLHDGRIALAHGHAGVWILDWLGPGGTADPDPAYLNAPRAIGYYVPHSAGAVPPSWDPVHGSPWMWGTAVDERGMLWASDVASGLYGLSPAPGA